MLKAAPAVTEAVVTGVGGDRFFNAYLPEFGTEWVAAATSCVLR